MFLFTYFILQNIIFFLSKMLLDRQISGQLIFIDQGITDKDEHPFHKDFRSRLNCESRC